MKTSRSYRWFVVAVFFAFMLLHQSDRLLIGPLTTPIMETFGIDEAQMGLVSSFALAVSAILYPLWGYLYDRYARSRLLALASFIWGSTTWLSAIAPTYPTFLASRASTGIDDSSYPGLYSLIADYFEPKLRGRIYGILQLAQPMGYMLGMVMAMMLSPAVIFGSVVGWRGVYYITGSLGILLAIVIFFGVREAPRGKSEPELAELEKMGIYRFDWNIAKGLFRKRALLLLFAQGFFGVFPWNVITFWFFRYLETERNYDGGAVLMTMVIAVLVLAFGYFAGGAVGDFLFRRTPRGRLITCTAGVFLGAALLLITINIPIENQMLFLVMLSATALFIPFSSPNVISTVYDITLPEVRSTALAVQYFIESAGAATAPFLAGLIAVRSSLGAAILLICTSAWIICGILLAFAAYLIPTDIETLRSQLRERAEHERALQAGG